MFISSDGHLYIYSNANQIANRKGLCFSNTGILSPIGTGNINIGIESSPFNVIYAQSIVLHKRTGETGATLSFDDEGAMIQKNTENHLKIHAGSKVEISGNHVRLDEGILYFGGSGTTERIELGNRMLRFYGYNGLDFQSYIRSDICPTNTGMNTLGKSAYRWKEICLLDSAKTKKRKMENQYLTMKGIPCMSTHFGMKSLLR